MRLSEKKLSIVVPHYNEPWSTCKPLFDSIALQQGIDFDSIEVLVVEDGFENVLPRERLVWDKENGYPFKIRNFVIPHSGVSAARNYGLKEAAGEYVQFCDCDDMYLNNYGLHMVFSAINEDFDVLISPFVEEQWTDTGYQILRHEVDDITFVHGKIFRKEYLDENAIRFNDDLTLHEDGFFVSLAMLCTKKCRAVNSPFYLWKWNENSVVRVNRNNFVMRTYSNLLDCRAALARELEKRGLINDYISIVCRTVLDTYYDMQKPEYTATENAKYVKRAKKAFAKFFNEFKREYFEANPINLAEFAKAARDRAYEQGMIMEKQTIADFIKEIQCM